MTRRTSTLLTLLTVVGLPVGITTSLFGELPITDPARYGWAFAATMLGLFAFFGALFAAWRRFAPV